MAEQSSRACPELYRLALIKATATRNDYWVTLLDALNPRRLSPADIEMLHDMLEVNQCTH